LLKREEPRSWETVRFQPVGQESGKAGMVMCILQGSFVSSYNLSKQCIR
jgi:hypothetical protein